MGFLGLAAQQGAPPQLPAAASRGTLRSKPARKVHLRPFAVAAGTQSDAKQQRQQQRRQSPAAHSRLQDPAKLEGSLQASVPVQDRGGSISLDTYMRLPPEQYSELDPAMIRAMGGNTFLLKVPRLALLNVWVEPEVVVSVRLMDGPPSVVFESVECRLHGSDLLNQLGLDRRFLLSFHTLLTWQSGGRPRQQSTTASSNSSPGALAAATSNGNGSGSSVGCAGSISGNTVVQVWSEVIGPFKAIPRPMLQATGNAVLGALMQALLPIFLNKLADDYQRWASNAEYRARRAAVRGQDRQLPPPQTK